MIYHFEKVVSRNEKPIPKEIDYRAPMLYKDKYSAICIEHITEEKRLSEDFLYSLVKALVYVDNGKTKKIIHIRDQFRYFKYDKQSLIQFCKFRIKDYKKSVKRFGFKNIKKNLFEETNKNPRTYVNISKISVYYDNEDDLCYSFEVINPKNGRSIKFVDSEIEIIYPSLGYKYSIPKSLETGDLVKVINFKLLSKLKKGVENKWKLLSIDHNLNVYKKSVVRLLNKDDTTYLTTYIKNIKKINSDITFFSEKTTNLNVLHDFIKKRTSRRHNKTKSFSESIIEDFPSFTDTELEIFESEMSTPDPLQSSLYSVLDVCYRFKDGHSEWFTKFGIDSDIIYYVGHDTGRIYTNNRTFYNGTVETYLGIISENSSFERFGLSTADFPNRIPEIPLPAPIHVTTCVRRDTDEIIPCRILAGGQISFL